MPRISVIVPVYNVEKYLNRCVDSILAQTFRDYEIILVDDGSPDASPKICDDYAAKYDFIRVIHKENGGLSSARNTGIKVAQGKYLMFLDSDDYLDKVCLDSLMNGRDSNDVDLIIGSIVYAYENNCTKIFQKKRDSILISKKNFAEILPSLLDERRINYVHGKLYKGEIIKKYNLFFENEKLTSAEDTVFNFTFLKFCDNIQICGASVHFYMQHEGLARKFVEDRYKRFGRLSDFIEKTCEEINLYNEEMKAVIDKRRVLSAIWCKDSIINAEIKKKKKIELLNYIYVDERLKEILHFVHIDGKEDLLYLVNNGSKKYINYNERRRFYNRIKGFAAKITPKFIKTIIKHN